MNTDAIDRLKRALDARRPLPREVVASLRADVALRWTYHSNAIEGNTHTLKETKAALEGVTVGGKTLREHLEIINHREAIDYAEALAGGGEPLTEHAIKSLHQLVLKGIDDKNAGVYRSVNVRISGAAHVPPDALDVPAQMAAFVRRYKSKAAAAMHPVERAARMHSEFVKIHPFVDGNGRTARLLMNLQLMKDGFPPAVLPVERRVEYYEALDAMHTKDDDAAFLRLMADIAESAFDPYLHALRLDKAAVIAPPNAPPPDAVFYTDERRESQIPAARLLMAMGYEYLAPADALRQRRGKKSAVLLENILAAHLPQINRINYKGGDYPFSDGNIQEAVQRLKNVRFDGLQRANREVYDNMLAQGIALPQTVEGDKKSFSLRFIDWDKPQNNRFHMTLEYEVERERGGGPARPDIVLFVNGIPLAVIECKALNTGEDGIAEGVSQCIRNQTNDYIPRLFIYNQLMLAMNKNKAKYATAGADAKFWSVWQEPELEDENSEEYSALAALVRESARFDIHPRSLALSAAAPDAEGRLATAQDRALYALCRPGRLLELARRFTLFEGGIKKIARYQQYFVIKAMLRRVMEDDEDGRRRGGVVWHTQGSGKSLTMVMLARNLALLPELNARIVLVSDRRDLDRQISGTFKSCGMDEARRATSARNLLELVGEKRAGVITTLVHKFDKLRDVKKHRDESRDIFVLADESHRTQFGAIAAQMRRMFPKACYFGFTGTPLMKKEKNSFQRFGALVRPHYTVRQAVADGAVLPLLYQGRHAEMKQNKAAVDLWFERHTEDLSEAQKKDLKKKHARAAVLNKADRVIYMRAFDIRAHYRANFQGAGLKAQLAAPDKAAAVKYRRYFNEIGGVSAEVIISPPDMREGHEKVEGETRGETADFWKEMMDRYGGETAYNEAVIGAYKDRDEPEILIVVDKLLTGFDAPRNAVLYLCRSLREHNLLQAIGRVNRLHSGKEYGHIVDYAGALSDLDKALTTYDALAGFDEDDIASALIPIDDEVKKLPDACAHLWDMFKEIKRRGDREEFEMLLADDDKRHEFYARLTRYTKTLAVALSSGKFLDKTDDGDMARYKSALSFFSALRRAVAERYADRINYKEYGRKIKNLLDKHVRSGKVTPLNEPVDMLDDDFAAKAGKKRKGARRDKTDAARADAIAYHMKKHISERMDEDPAFYARFSKLVQDAIDDFLAKRLSAGEYLDKTKELSAALRGDRPRDDAPPRLAGNAAAAAYYGVLLPVLREGPGGALSDDALTAAAADIALRAAAVLKAHRTVNFWEDENARREAKNEIDDAFYKTLEDERGVALSSPAAGAMISKAIQSILRTAKARYERERR